MTVAIVKPNLYDHGHTFGEFKIFAAILWGAQKLGAATVVVTTRAEAAQVHGSNVIVVSDQYTEAALKRGVRAQRRYNVDFWGTPREQAVVGTTPAQYLVPYPYACGNTFLGFRVEDAAFRAAPPQKEAGLVVVLGKEPKYFTPAVRRALEEIARLPGVSRMVATVPKNKAGGLPACVENRGLLNPGAYAQLLGAAQVALGLGAPVLGPGALDALDVLTLRIDRPVVLLPISILPVRLPPLLLVAHAHRRPFLERRVHALTHRPQRVPIRLQHRRRARG